MDVIEIRNLSKSYILNKTTNSRNYLNFYEKYFNNSKNGNQKKTYTALNNINIKIKKGEIVGIIGPNGAGKSTLLKILSKITVPSNGEVKIRGILSSLLEVGTGFHPELTGRENIILNGAIIGISQKRIERKMEKIINFSGIGKFIDIPVKKYSSGMYTRLAFSVAAHMDSDILLIDEVLSVGDLDFQKKCLGKINEITETREKTVLFVSHNLNAISELCSVCIYMKGGQIILYNKTDKVIQKYLEDYEKKLVTNCFNDKNNSNILKNISFKENNHNNQKSITCGEEVDIQIDYKSKESIHDAIMGLAFTDNNKQFVTFFNNKITGKVYKELPNEGSLICHIPKLPLMPGWYNITISLMSGGRMIDQVVDAVRILVKKGDFYNSGNFGTSERQGVFVEHKWSYNK